MTVAERSRPALTRWLNAGPLRRLWAFAAVVVVLASAAVLARPAAEVLPFLLVLVPPAAAFLVGAVAGGRREVRSTLGRLGRWRVRPGWYLVAVAIPIVEKVVVDAAGVLVWVSTPARIVDALTVSALVIPLVVLIPALLEELGWRGYAVQAAVDAGRSPAWAAAVVGVMFVTLHVPLYLPGQVYDGLPVWPLPMILVAGSVLMTWIYLRTRSVLLAGLLHASLNATVPLTWGLDPAWVWQARAVVLVTIAVVVLAVEGRWWWSAPGRTARGRATRSGADSPRQTRGV